MRRILALWLILFTTMPALAAPPVIVVFVHGRYEDASGPDWADDDAQLDGAVMKFSAPTPLGTKDFYGVSDGAYMHKRIRETYWRVAKACLSETVEKRVGRGGVLYVRYDARDSWYYEPKSAPLVAQETRAWLMADARLAEPARNIVWIAHSNGGLIVRELMSDPQYADLVARTREVITIGTPHRGSEMADAGREDNRVKTMSDTMVDADVTVGRAARLFGGFTVFDLAPRYLHPYLAQVKAQVKAQGGPDVGQRVRRAQADWLARVFERELSGRIDEQLTTQFMEASQRPDAEHRLLTAAELPVPFFWVRGSLYPMDILRLVGGVFKVGQWDDNDLVLFATSSGIVSQRLMKRFPDHPQWHSNDGVVSVESAAALGQPLEGSESGATVPVHHCDLLLTRRVRDLVDRHLLRLQTGR